MNDWTIMSTGDEPSDNPDYDWSHIDAAIAQLAQLQARIQDLEAISPELIACISEVEQAISVALSQGLSVRAIGARTNISQHDVKQVRDTGRLYER